MSFIPAIGSRSNNLLINVNSNSYKSTPRAARRWLSWTTWVLLLVTAAIPSLGQQSAPDQQSTPDQQSAPGQQSAPDQQITREPEITRGQKITRLRRPEPGPVRLFAQEAEDCNGNGDPSKNPNHILPPGEKKIDLKINGVHCVVDGSGSAGAVRGSYVYRNVNIYNGGTLIFKDARIDFHAHSILVEMNSTLTAGAITHQWAIDYLALGNEDGRHSKHYLLER